jgi:hypothetical protein
MQRADVQIGGATVTAPSDRLIRRIRRDFGRGVDDEVIRRLTALAPDDSSERFQAAMVLGAAGKLNRFEQQLRRLEKDWRVMLAVGGLADVDWSDRLDAELPAAQTAPPPPGGPGASDGRVPPGSAAPARSARRDASAPRRTVARRPRPRPR